LRSTKGLTCRLILASQVTLKTTFSAKWPPHTRAEGGQVEPMLGTQTATLFLLCFLFGLVSYKFLCTKYEHDDNNNK
jgi:hypothetical protein